MNGGQTDNLAARGISSLNSVVDIYSGIGFVTIKEFQELKTDK